MMKAKLLRGTHSMYGKTNDIGFTVIAPTAMGKSWSHFNSMKDAIKAVKIFEQNKAEIMKQKKAIDDYCSKNPWTYSGT